MTQANSKDTDRIEIRKTYYPSGTLWWETPFVNGQRHGIAKGYYESGALMWEAPFVNGEMHGIEKTYYGSGTLQCETPFVNGEMHGIEKKYNREKSVIDRLTLYNKDLIFLLLRR